MATTELTFPSIPGVRKVLVETDGPYLTLLNIIIDPEHRRLGHGTYVINQVKHMARTHKKRGIRLSVLPIGPAHEQVSHADLVRFYKQNGFQLLRGTDDQFIWYV